MITHLSTQARTVSGPVKVFNVLTTECLLQTQGVKRKPGMAHEFYILSAKKYKTQEAQGEVADDGTVRVNVPLHPA